ncbi:hypothetical protein E1B28_005591 [Marasmius oreades]|uniref:Uncharacterized protein n=1 Tax=Marasmius oreades TaxID=181124 RepID=A0A9P7UUZ8_9AGAR|nr:uncharacterized protein E1B28_005591 [Marasmius oreades]KAG7094775.1 hypothetical protein E1B28_005591 [Marasmius oreades]
MTTALGGRFKLQQLRNVRRVAPSPPTQLRPKSLPPPLRNLFLSPQDPLVNQPQENTWLLLGLHLRG